MELVDGAPYLKEVGQLIRDTPSGSDATSHFRVWMKSSPASKTSTCRRMRDVIYFEREL